MKQQIQITLFSDKGYKPVSCLVEVENVEYYKEHLKEVKAQGIQKICNKRYWEKYHLIQYGYTKVKMRIYDKEEIKKEKTERYERIKRERGWA